MRLEVLVISDTHLGEETSLLSFPHGRQRFWHELRLLFGEGASNSRKLRRDKMLDVKELIMLGDIPDRTLSSTSQITTHTNAFVHTLGSLADIKKGVYVPGNHDHTLWKNYREGNKGPAITGPTGNMIVHEGKRFNKKDKSEEILSAFFGYEDGSAWRAIEDAGVFDFVVANPVYVKDIGGRTYVFAHGTHFRKEVVARSWIRKLADCLEMDEAFGNIEIEPGGEVSEAKNLEDLENKVAPFVDSLWPSSRNNPTSRSDQLWYLLNMLSGKFAKKRDAPEESMLFALKDLPNVEESRIKRLTIADESIGRWKKYFLPHMLDYLEQNNISQDNITFVYGDTHDGGWGEIPADRNGQKIRVYNCGGWVVHGEAGHPEHPVCHVFAVDENGDEYLADISYKRVEVDGESLINLAARDSEHRYQNTSRILRVLLKLLMPS